MKSIAMWSASFASGALVGLLGSWLILDIMAGFPDRKSGGSWDIGPIAFPVMGFVAYLLAHSLCYVIIDEERKARRTLLAACLGAICYCVAVFAIAKAHGYKG